MRLVLKIDANEQIQSLITPTITVITALRNAIDTNSNMLGNPPIFSDDAIFMDMFWESEVKEEEKESFQKRTLNALDFIFSEAGIDYQAHWE